MKLYDVYPLFDINIVKGKGCKVWDDKGQEYLDLYGGHAVISIGHCHPHYVEMLTNQLNNLGFYSNSVINKLQVKLAERLGKISGYEDYQFFLINSGAEANENALKLASFTNGRTRVLSIEKAFHGRTSLAVEVTNNPKIIAPINDNGHVTYLPIAGKDFKTGQTLVKSGFAPIIGTRCLGLNGWFSTNILGNRDGLVLDEPANFHTKEVSKLSTLETILKPEAQPDLYGHGNDDDTQYYHKVRINYYPPRNDNKEGWDNIDIFGWMGYPMQIKINFLCRDSILAAPLLLDLTLLSDLAARAGRFGIQRFLSFFLKAPMHDYTKGEEPVNHLYQQYTMLKNAIREMGGYEADEEID